MDWDKAAWVAGIVAVLIVGWLVFSRMQTVDDLRNQLVVDCTQELAEQCGSHCADLNVTAWAEYCADAKLFRSSFQSVK